MDFFYKGMSPSTKKMVEASSECSLLDMTPKEAMEFLEFLVDTSRKWEEYQLQEELTTASIVKGKVSTMLSFYIRAFIKELGKIKSKITHRTKLGHDTRMTTKCKTSYFPSW